MNQARQAAAERLRAGISQAGQGLIDRESLVELTVLAAVAGEHLLVVGAPGTAKSQAVRRIAGQLGGNYFEYLLGRFTEPSELFGPVDLARLREGSFETRTDGMLPEADVAFLDEVFRGSSAILNTLLGILNEGRFRRGASIQACPLRVCIAAANHLPEDEVLAAFADRFLLHLFVEPVSDAQMEGLLSAGWQSERRDGPAAASLADLDCLIEACREVNLDGVRPLLADALRSLRGADFQLSDRRIVRSQALVAASAALAGREQATAADLWPLVHILRSPEDQSRARELLREQLAASEHPLLPHAVEEASSGPLVRARRLCGRGRELLDIFADTTEHPQRLRLQLEAVAREIDAGFAPNSLPSELADLRSEISARLDSSSS